MSRENENLNTLYDELKELRNRAWAGDYTTEECGDTADKLLRMIGDMKLARIDEMLEKIQ